MNSNKLFFALSLLFLLTAPSLMKGQGGFFRVNTQYNVTDFQYSTPWDQYFDFNTKTSYIVGLDYGYSVKPRNSQITMRYTLGVQYEYVNLDGTIKNDVYNRQFILNKGFSDVYDFIAVPLRMELLFTPRSTRAAPPATFGLAGSLIVSAVLDATSDVTMFDGTHQNYTIDTRNILLSGALGGLVDLALTRNLIFELYAGYHYTFQNLLTAQNASLHLNYAEISARLKINLYRYR
jgi:hypothetical protein